VSLEVPIFSGISSYAGYKAARYDRLAAGSEARSMRQAAELALVQAWNSAGEAFEQVSATEATLAQAEEAAGIATVSYEAGMITRLEMDQSFLALTLARSNNARALYSLRTAEARLARAMGTLRIGE
jgi:outer membrane protein TolC